jgi:hypothetical protein
MTQCKVINCESTELVYSGTDAFMLGGILTETYCYDCANAYNQISRDMKAASAGSSEAEILTYLAAFGVTSD